MPLKIALIVPFLLQIVITVGITGWLSLRHGEQSVQNLATQLMEKAGQQVNDSLSDYLETPRRINAKNHQLLQQSDILKDPDLIRRLFWTQTQGYPEVSYISYTQSDGQFIGVGRWLAGYDQVSDEISSAEPGIVRTHELGIGGEQVKLLLTEAYEPREQSWYLNTLSAQSEVWTFTIEETVEGNRAPYAGLSLNQPIYLDPSNPDSGLIGMVGTDLLIDEISDYLTEIAFSPSGKIFITEHDGTIIGSSSQIPIIHQRADGQFERSTLASVNNDFVRQLSSEITHWGQTSMDVLEIQEVNINQQKHYLLYRDWNNAQGLDWTIILAVPEADFIGRIKANAKTTVALCIIALLISTFIGLYIVKKIVDPFTALSETSQAMARGELTPHQANSGPGLLLEVDELSQNLTHMSQQLEASFSELHYRRQHDGLTGLLNREAFRESLQYYLDHSPRLQQAEPFRAQQALLILDLDYFKLINDSLGHLVGDRLLLEVSKRLKSYVREGELIARFGGDEFVLFLSSIIHQEDAECIANRLIKILQKPFPIEEHEIYIDGSIGIVMISRDADSADNLLRSADVALDHAKSNGRSRYEVFDQHMHADVLNRLHLKTDIHNALEREEFSLHYQPIVYTASRQVQGFEALIRWHHPEKGWISPGKFIPVAEETDLIIRLGWWVLEEACQQMATWQLHCGHIDQAKISVNVSSKQFLQSDFVQGVEKILNRVSLSPNNLKLEVTESLLMSHEGAIQKKFLQLRAMGIQLSLDDFGTGYSSLSYLHKFKLDTLKIDQSFIQQMEQSRQNHAIIKTIVELAKHMDMDVVAEGVEEATQLQALQRMNCEMLQGYFIARPMNAQSIVDFLARNRMREQTVATA